MKLSYEGYEIMKLSYEGHEIMKLSYEVMTLNRLEMKQTVWCRVCSIKRSDYLWIIKFT